LCDGGAQQLDRHCGCRLYSPPHRCDLFVSQRPARPCGLPTRLLWTDAAEPAKPRGAPLRLHRHPAPLPSGGTPAGPARLQDQTQHRFEAGMTIILQAEGIRKSFLEPKRLDVLAGVALTVCQGESVAICGRSGEGKTTLLHILGTLERPDFGSLSI